jgi:hypothetical protein
MRIKRFASFDKSPETFRGCCGPWKETAVKQVAANAAPA